MRVVKSVCESSEVCVRVVKSVSESSEECE